MLKQILSLVAALTLSLSVNASIVDLRNITRDTATGLDWLDLTETNGRSYNDISSKLGAGQEFEGWRYASNAETEQLWQHFGFVDGLNGGPFSGSDLEYNFFVTAVSLLGNTIDDYGYEYYETGVLGYTSDFSDCCNIHTGGMWKDVSYVEPLVKVQGTLGNWASLDQKHLGYGSYLVAPSAIPIPATGWLFMLALLCLAGNKRLSRP